MNTKKPIKEYTVKHKELFKKVRDLQLVLNDIEGLMPENQEVMTSMARLFFAAGDFSMIIGLLLQKGEI